MAFRQQFAARYRATSEYILKNELLRRKTKLYRNALRAFNVTTSQVTFSRETSSWKMWLSRIRNPLRLLTFCYGLTETNKMTRYFAGVVSILDVCLMAFYLKSYARYVETVMEVIPNIFYLVETIITSYVHYWFVTHSEFVARFVLWNRFDVVGLTFGLTYCIVRMYMDSEPECFAVVLNTNSYFIVRVYEVSYAIMEPIRNFLQLHLLMKIFSEMDVHFKKILDVRWLRLGAAGRTMLRDLDDVNKAVSHVILALLVVYYMQITCHVAGYITLTDNLFYIGFILLKVAPLIILIHQGDRCGQRVRRMRLKLFRVIAVFHEMGSLPDDFEKSTWQMYAKGKFAIGSRSKEVHSDSKSISYNCSTYNRLILERQNLLCHTALGIETSKGTPFDWTFGTTFLGFSVTSAMCVYQVAMSMLSDTDKVCR